MAWGGRRHEEGGKDWAGGVSAGSCSAADAQGSGWEDQGGKMRCASGAEVQGVCITRRRGWGVDTCSMWKCVGWQVGGCRPPATLHSHTALPQRSKAV
jgi:hypothetical protein